MSIVSKDQPLLHYIWGDACDGWNLADHEGLSVKIERMPAGTAEAMHYHRHSQQFFFILEGEAEFEIEAERIIVKKQQGIHIHPMKKHRISNRSEKDLEFILCSQPSTKADRHNLE